MPHVNLTDECPCQNGKIFAQCCARTNFKPLYAATKTPGQKTGIKNPRCYAAELGDCSEKITREHFLSEGILKILNENGGLTVAGLSWLEKGEHKKIAPPSLVGNVLCKRHNEALSPLDAVAIRFFRAFRQIEQEFNDDAFAGIDRVFLFNGYDIERWMLKTLCGILNSNNAVTTVGKITDWVPRVTWLNMLFGTQKFPVGGGIYYEAEVGRQREIYQGVDFAPVTDQDNVVFGAHISLKENGFILAMSPPAGEKQGTILEHCVYRPHQLIMEKRGGSANKVIVLAWDSPTDEKDIKITLDL